MFSEERREKILEKVVDNGRVMAKDLADEFHVSIDSIRRDLSIMEEEGLLKRTHGGAIPNPKARNKPQMPEERYGKANPGQKAIARSAAGLINEGETVFIGGASIHNAMLEYLPRNIPYTVVTNSVEVAYRIKEYANIETLLIGGMMKGSGNITDSIANEFTKQFTVDVNFATAGGISARGLSTSTPEVAVFLKTVMTRSKKNIALMEHQKLGVDLFAGLDLPLSKVDLLITNDESDREKVEVFESAGVKVCMVSE
ncbi:DeoR/GlpR family DNA-binding transcription regulator [Rossellomorea aquimaris]|uniref:DeoR family transcriptional regulator n=1 Tax=Rossellomorea aquimaris TaxID=189382 RepID=A0A1J6WJC6_9BACI|nr:DeoR/GlpR family DNA-binding transcription regulator [Rossellomorea aquimaris]OIU71944.1 DeoR family transcriptional regulator [Rossellomorea aquimaris]